MKASVPPSTVEHGGLEIVHDDPQRAATEELQGMDQRAVEFGLALREAELQVAQATVAEDGHEDRQLALRVADADRSAMAPIHLHRLARFIVHLLINPPPPRTDLPQVVPHDGDFSAVGFGTLAEFFQHPDGRQLRALVDQRLDLRLVRIEETAALRPTGLIRRMAHVEGLFHRPLATTQTPGNRPVGQLFHFR